MENDINRALEGKMGEGNRTLDGKMDEGNRTLEKKKILFVIDSFYTTNNGTSISAQRFAGELRKRGHEVRVLCWDTPKEGQRDEVESTKDKVQSTMDKVQSTKEEVQSTKGEVQSTKDDVQSTMDDFTTEKFRIPVFQTLCDKHDFSFAYNDKEIVHKACDWADIVHIYVPFGITWEAVHYCNKIGKPVTGAFHIQPENMTSSVNMGKVEWFNELFYRTFRQSVYNRVRHVHVPSKFMGNMIAERGYTAKIHVISNGIQNEFLEAGKQFIDHGRPAKSPELEGKIVITMVGRLSGEKRQDVLINAVQYSKYADQIQLVFAGKGPKHDEYAALGEHLKNKPMFLYLTKEQLIHHLGMTDLYVHASDMESEAISCIEAFATGLVPVIANSDVSATPQFALDGRSLFMPGNPKDLARAIDYWLDHPNERKFIGELYYQSAKRYTLENSVTQFEQMLKEEIEDCAKEQEKRKRIIF